MNALASFRFLREFLFEFGTLFAIINPYGLAFIFLERTNGLSDRDRSSVALQIAINAFVVLVASYFAGTLILSFFGISLSALRIGGGLVVASSGWVMLPIGKRAKSKEARPATNLELAKKMAFFPFTMPLTTGPGTIAASIALAANRHDGLHGTISSSAIWILVAAAVSLTIFHAYGRANMMARLFGADGTRIVSRLSAFLLLCVGVQIVTTGVSDILRQLIVTPPP